MKSDLILFVASVASLITFLVARHIFQNQLKLGPPTLLAAMVAGLAFAGFTSHSSGLCTVLLLPYEALAVTLLPLFLIFCLLTWLRGNPKQRQPHEFPFRDAGHRRRRPITKPKPTDVSDRPKRATGLRGPLAPL